MSRYSKNSVNPLFVKQSTCEKTFYGMTRKEEDERSNRLAYKALNGIVDEETIAADERALKSIALLFGKTFEIRFRKQ